MAESRPPAGGSDEPPAPERPAGSTEPDPSESTAPRRTEEAAASTGVLTSHQQVAEKAPPAEPKRGKHEERKERRGGFLGFLRELPGLILIAFALALIIKTFVIQAFYIPSQSMVPTLKVGDRVIVNKFIYHFHDPRRGDVIVFENPHLKEPDRGIVGGVIHWLTEGLGFSTDPDKDFIKRVIGLPGDSIEVREGKVFVNGQRIIEPYVNPHARDRSDFGPEKVKPDHVFVMGDNRPNSEDSRSALGQIPYDNIVGRAFLLLWPPSRIQWLSGG